MIRFLLVLLFVGGVLLFCWWVRREPEPEYQQGSAVDRVLYHHFHPPREGQPPDWPAGQAWHEYGRRMTVALIRQGIGDLLNEEYVDNHRPVFELGFTLGEDGKDKAIDALRKKVERRDETIKELREERDDLLHQLEQLREQRPNPSEPVRSVRAAPAHSSDDYNELLEEYWGSPKSMDELLAERGYVRAASPEAEPLPEPEPEPKEENEEAPPPLTFPSVKERNAAIVEYRKSHSVAETALSFGISESLVKTVMSNFKKQVKAG